MFTKKLLFLMMLCIGFLSCSSDEYDNTETTSPITNLEIPQSSIDNPIKAGESVNLKGAGFIQTSEIWLRSITKSTDVKAEIISVTASGISFKVPNVSGERSIILKQLGEEYVLGKMYFNDSSQTVVKKRASQWLKNGKVVYEFNYNKDGRLEKLSKVNDIIYTFTYNDAGQLLTAIESDYSSKEKVSKKLFEYKNPQTILVHETYDDDEEANGTITITLNQNGLMTKKEDKIQYYETYEYDELGNLIKQGEYYYDNTTITDSYEYTYEYDNQKSYLSNQGLPLWYWVYNGDTGFGSYAGSNNIVKEYRDGKLGSSFKFDYDEDGYPTVVYEDESGNGNFTKEFDLVYE